jgi:hypothetical protein
MGPLGILLMGGVASLVGPMLAIELVATAGFIAISAIGAIWRRRERAGMLLG